MKTLTATLLAALLLAAVSATASAPAHAAGGRLGTVLELQPIENRGDDETGQAKLGRKIGQGVGSVVGLLGGSKLMQSDNTAVRMAGSAAGHGGGRVGSEVGAKVAGPGPATRYMVKVKLDSGKTLSLPQLREQVDGLQVGSRVRVEGSGGNARVFAE